MDCPPLTVVEGSQELTLVFPRIAPDKEFRVQYRRRSGKAFYCIRDVLGAVLPGCREEDAASIRRLIEGLYQHHFIYVHQFQRQPPHPDGTGPANPYNNLYVNNEGLAFVCNRLLPLKASCQTAVTDRVSACLMALLSHLAEGPLCRSGGGGGGSTKTASNGCKVDDVEATGPAVKTERQGSADPPEFAGRKNRAKWWDIRARVDCKSEEDFVTWLLDTADMVMGTKRRRAGEQISRLGEFRR